MVLSVYQWLQNNSFIMLMNGTTIGSAIVEVLHYFGFFLLIGSIAIVDLRLLGLVGQRQSVRQIGAQVFGIMWVGMVLSLLTGFIMFAGSATQYYSNDVFYIKVGIVLVAILCTVIIQWNVPKWDLLPAPPASAKLLAVASIVLWIGAILAGVEVPALTGVG